MPLAIHPKLRRGGTGRKRQQVAVTLTGRSREHLVNAMDIGVKPVSRRTISGPPAVATTSTAYRAEAWGTSTAAAIPPSSTAASNIIFQPRRLAASAWAAFNKW